MPNWTDEQLGAIESYGCPTIVSAAAGSGKTAVLVERTIRLLCDEKKSIPADSLLAVTFTNDAASQMREKLSAAFEQAVINNPDSAWIQKQQALIRLADICTINSFCFDMVRNNLPKTAFQSGVRIMDEKEAQMVAETALDRVMENAYKTRPEELELLISRFSNGDDEQLKSYILTLYYFLRSLPFKDVWTANVISSFENGSAVTDATSFLAERAMEELTEFEKLSSRLRSCTDSLVNYSSAANKLYQICDMSDELAKRLRSEEARGDWDRLREEVYAYKPLSLAGVRQTKLEKQETTAADEIRYKNAMACKDSLSKKLSEIAACLPCSLETAKSDSKIVGGCFRALVALTNELWAEVDAVKAEKNALDFADTELLTVKLLVDCSPDGKLTRTPLAQEIVSSGRYKLILIDEFQDINNLQEVIFKAISDTPDMKNIGSNVFVVGDVKQAIYRFRRANPKIFMNTRLGAKNGSGVREILLTKNFRSRGSVLDFANYIFSSLMCSDLGEVEYSGEEALVCGASYPEKDPPCTIITVNSDNSDAEENEFRAVAGKIRRMIDAGVPVKDGDGVRPCRPGDFCVLTRNNVSADSLFESFESMGLKVMSGSFSGYLRSREISLMLNLMRITVSPMRDIPMASVMLSGLMGFTDDEISLVRLRDKGNRLYKNVLEISVEEPDSPIGIKCASAVGLIRRLRALSASMPLTRFIKKAYDLTDMFSMAAAYEDGEQKCANLYLLLEYAKKYESSSNDGVPGFLQYVEYILKTDGDFAEALTVTESEDAVNVKTIHKSKGLEYPFVFLCRLGKQFNSSDSKEKLLLNDEHGAGVRYNDYETLTVRKTIFYEHISRLNKSETLSEELRLLYVAMTRAKERLFIVMDTGKDACRSAQEYSRLISSHEIMPSLSRRAKSMQDWLIMALIKHPEFTCLGESGYKDAVGLPDIAIEAATTTEGTAKTGEKETESGKGFDSELSERIYQSFNFANDDRLCKSEAKLSVSEIAKGEYDGFYADMPELTDAPAELTPAQKGTILHRFMQLADYEKASSDLEGEISRLTDSGMFTRREAASINRRSISAFFESGVYHRMRRSRNVMREKSFIVRFSDIRAGDQLAEIYAGTQGMLQGIADCVFEEDDGYVIVDYKSDRITSLDNLKDRYSMQLLLYKAAFDILLDKPVKSCYIYSYRLADGVEVELDGIKE